MNRISSLLLCLPAAACSSTPEVQLLIDTTPEGAQVYFARHGDRNYQGSVGPVEGDVKKEDVAEEFVFIGDTPVKHSALLEETESGGTVLGFGAKVVLEYDEGVVRIEKAGYETVERRLKLEDGEVKLRVRLNPAAAPDEQASSDD